MFLEQQNAKNESRRIPNLYGAISLFFYYVNPLSNKILAYNISEIKIIDLLSTVIEGERRENDPFPVLPQEDDEPDNLIQNDESSLRMAIAQLPIKVDILTTKLEQLYKTKEQSILVKATPLPFDSDGEMKNDVITSKSETLSVQNNVITAKDKTTTDNKKVYFFSIMKFYDHTLYDMTLS